MLQLGDLSIRDGGLTSLVRILAPNRTVDVNHLNIPRQRIEFAAFFGVSLGFLDLLGFSLHCGLLFEALGWFFGVFFPILPLGRSLLNAAEYLSG